jgi:hypothetical protein
MNLQRSLLLSALVLAGLFAGAQTHPYPKPQIASAEGQRPISR